VELHLLAAQVADVCGGDPRRRRAAVRSRRRVAEQRPVVARGGRGRGRARGRGGRHAATAPGGHQGETTDDQQASHEQELEPCQVASTWRRVQTSSCSNANAVAAVRDGSTPPRGAGSPAMWAATWRASLPTPGSTSEVTAYWKSGPTK